MALLEMQDKISDSQDKNEFDVRIFFDLSKVFKTVKGSSIHVKDTHKKGIEDWFKQLQNMGS